MRFSSRSSRHMAWMVSSLSMLPRYMKTLKNGHFRMRLVSPTSTEVVGCQTSMFIIPWNTEPRYSLIDVHWIRLFKLENRDLQKHWTCGLAKFSSVWVSISSYSLYTKFLINIIQNVYSGEKRSIWMYQWNGDDESCQLTEGFVEIGVEVAGHVTEKPGFLLVYVRQRVNARKVDWRQRHTSHQHFVEVEVSYVLAWKWNAVLWRRTSIPFGTPEKWTRWTLLTVTLFWRYSTAGSPLFI